VGLERGSLSLGSRHEELLERKSSGSGLEIREYGQREPSCLPRGTLYPRKLALKSPTNSGRSVSISSVVDSVHGVRFFMELFRQKVRWLGRDAIRTRETAMSKLRTGC
jgi:hypothetical protein